jgi:hypothetical protein
MTHQPEHDPLVDLAASGADVDTAVLAVTTDDVRAGCDVLAGARADSRAGPSARALRLITAPAGKPTVSG